MPNKIITFKKGHLDEDWKAEDPENNHYARICNGTFVEYIGLPAGCGQFDVVFSVEKPVTGDHFAIIEDEDDNGNQITTLETEDQISWYDGAIDLLRELHLEGYRYVQVEH